MLLAGNAFGNMPSLGNASVGRWIFSRIGAALLSASAWLAK
jgi:hypothetical protein